MNTYFSRISLVSLIALTHVSAFAMFNGDELDDKSNSSAASSTSSKASAEKLTPKELASQLLKEGYFVHAVRQNLFDYDLTLNAGSMLPMTANFGGMADAILSSLGGQLSSEDQASLAGITSMAVKTTYLPNPDQFRPCLYFTLNCLVEGHEGLDISTYNSVVFIPTAELLPDVVNLYPSDTAVWRRTLDLKTIPGAVLMVPESLATPDVDTGKLKVISYSDEITEATNRFLDEHTPGMRIRLESAPEGCESLLDRAMLQGVDMGRPELFSELLANPAVSFGHEASPLRTGMGPVLKTLNILASDFNKMWKIGLLGEFPGVSKGPELLTRYRVEPFYALGKVLQSELERLLGLCDRPDMLADYLEVEKPKIDRALSNFDNYIKHNTKTGNPKEIARASKWQTRPYSFEVSLRLADFPYEVAAKVLNDSRLDGVREEMATHYWFIRSLNSFYGVSPVDELNPQEHLKIAAQALQAKLQGGGFSWTYAQYLNSIMALGMVNKGREDYKRLYLEGLKTLVPTLPAQGSLMIRTAEGINTVLVADTLRGFDIPLGKKFFKNGLKRVPTLETSLPVNNAY